MTRRRSSPGWHRHYVAAVTDPRHRLHAAVGFLAAMLADAAPDRADELASRAADLLVELAEEAVAEDGWSTRMPHAGLSQPTPDRSSK